MPDVGAALRGRTFGIPNGILLVAVAAGIWWFFIRGKGKAASTPQAAAVGSQLNTGYGLGYAQGLQASQANQPSAPVAPAGAAADNTVVADSHINPNNTTPGLIPLYSDTRGISPGGGMQFLSRGAGQPQVIGAVPDGTVLTVNGSVATLPWGSGQASFYPVTLAGAQFLVSVSDVRAGQGGGVGGGPSTRKHAIGSRSAWLHHDAHPLIGAPVKYAHYVRVGGPRTAASHHAAINRVAAQAGVHPTRVAMLNPVPTGLIRIA